MNRLYGGIEAGGTKFVCAVGSDPENLQEIRFDTTEPNETISHAIEYLKEQSSKKQLSAIGIGSFGPIDINEKSPTYGYITSTPKKYWKHIDFIGKIKQAFDIPIGFDTDVNVAALGEYCWGAGKGLTDFIYLTIGTGIGGGGMVNGKFLHGLVHPEMGHIFIPRHIEDNYEGICPFHKNNCFEGLASGPAIEERLGYSAEYISENHNIWDLEAYYISLALVNYICMLSPQRIIIGGGIMKQRHLISLIHNKVRTMLNNYIQYDEITKYIEDYIVLPKLGNRSGILGAIALAKQQRKVG